MAMLGMRGTGDWAPNERPTNIRETILYLYPHGSAPLTAIMSKMGSESVDDPAFSWWTKMKSTTQGPVTETDDLEVTSVKGSVITVVLPSRTAAANAGAMPKPPIPPAQPDGMPDPLYGGLTSPNRMARTDRTSVNSYATLIRPGHQILLQNTAAPTFSLNGKVLTVTPGASDVTTLTVQLNENAYTGAADVNFFQIIGNINPEGGEMPDAISYDPVQVWNYTQIFRTPLSITRTAQKTHTRTGNKYKELRREALEMHSWEMEKAFIFGQKNMITAPNGQPERTTCGIINFIKSLAPNNFFDATSTANAAGITQGTGGWTNTVNGITNGERFLDGVFEFLFRYGKQERLILCGNSALLAFNNIAKASGSINIAPKAETWGLDIRRWVTPFGTLNLMTHPFFNDSPIERSMALVLDPAQLKFKYIDDTSFFGEDGKNRATGTGHNRIDGLKEEYLTEAGLSFGLPQVCGVIYNVGKDRTA